MIFLGQQWVCNDCDAHILPVALEGIHYFPTTGIVHRKDGFRCRRYISTDSYSKQQKQGQLRKATTCC